MYTKIILNDKVLKYKQILKYHKQVYFSMFIFLTPCNLKLF
jgi:hypothetical protein